MALDTLIKKIEADPELSHPNPDKPFEVEIDVSPARESAWGQAHWTAVSSGNRP